VATDNSVC